MKDALGWMAAGAVLAGIGGALVAIFGNDSPAAPLFAIPLGLGLVFAGVAVVRLVNHIWPDGGAP